MTSAGQPPRPTSMRWLRTFSLAHLVSWLVLWLIFTCLTFAATSEGLTDKRCVLPTTLASIVGPMTGAISRGNQGCCLEFSLWLLPYAAACVAVGTAVQFAPTPKHWAAEVVRVGLWTLGWFGWFASGIISLGHAMS
jgi:hypothetical protein